MPLQPIIGLDGVRYMGWPRGGTCNERKRKGTNSGTTQARHIHAAHHRNSAGWLFFFFSSPPPPIAASSLAAKSAEWASACPWEIVPPDHFHPGSLIFLLLLLLLLLHSLLPLYIVIPCSTTTFTVSHPATTRTSTRHPCEDEGRKTRPRYHRRRLFDREPSRPLDSCHRQDGEGKEQRPSQVAGEAIVHPG